MRRNITRIIGLSLAAVLAMSDVTIRPVYAEVAESVVEEAADYDTAEEFVSEEESIAEEDVLEDDFAAGAVEEVTDDEIIIEEDEIIEEADNDFIDEKPVEESMEVSLPTGGLMDVEVEEVDYVDPDCVVYDVDELAEELSELREEDPDYSVDDLFNEEGSAVYENEWSKYASNYTYNKLPEKKKIAWKAYYNLCMDVLTKGEDYSSTFFGYVSSPGLFADIDDFAAFMKMFKYSNPQFFFLSNAASGSALSGSFSLGMYQNMKIGSDRAACITKFRSGIQTFKNDITYDANNEGATFKSIHDVVCNRVEYNQKSVDDHHVNEQTEYTQSCYSTFVLESTVCAGYAAGLSLLCNEAGIEVQALTSPGHAYNRVRLNDCWYNVDSTWADQDWGIYYGFYLRSSSFYASNGTSHVSNTCWNSYLPVCSRDCINGTGAVAGTPYVPTSKAAIPTITVSSGKVTIKTATSGAEIYYTTDGKVPSPGNTRSNVYTGVFDNPSNCTIKAIAVKDGLWDSDVATEVAGAVKYKITYALNGGVQNPSNVTTYTYNSGKITLNAPTKTGYKFSGWYTNAKFDSTTRITQIDTAKYKGIKVYAKWTPITYSLVLHNGDNSYTRYTSCKYGTSYKIQPHSFAKKGYSISNWNTKKDGTGKKYSDSSSVRNLTTKDGATVDLYLIWKLNTYTISYNLNGGKNNVNNPKSYTVKNSAITLKNPTKAGYKFAGWYTDSKFTAKITTIDTSKLVKVKVYAKWTPNKYNIKFVSNASGVTAPSAKNNLYYGTTYQLPTINTKIRSGYTFLGWSKKSGSTGASYKNGAKVKNLTTTDGDTVVLYAVWKKNK